MLEVASAGSLQGLAALRRRWSVCRLGGPNRVQRGPHTAEELSWQVAQAGAVAPRGLRCSVRLLWRAMPGAPCGAVILGGRQGAVCASVAGHAHICGAAAAVVGAVAVL